jgi:arginine/lysine/ornithine decarboxylase
MVGADAISITNTRFTTHSTHQLHLPHPFTRQTLPLDTNPNATARMATKTTLTSLLTALGLKEADPSTHMYWSESGSSPKETLSSSAYFELSTVHDKAKQLMIGAWLSKSEREDAERTIVLPKLLKAQRKLAKQMQKDEQAQEKKVAKKERAMLLHTMYLGARTELARQMEMQERYEFRTAKQAERLKEKIREADECSTLYY